MIISIINNTDSSNDNKDDIDNYNNKMNYNDNDINGIITYDNDRFRIGIFL